eukprot:1161744-Pelagomonas_calceolata.AAC.11
MDHSGRVDGAAFQEWVRLYPDFLRSLYLQRRGEGGWGAKNRKVEGKELFSASLWTGPMSLAEPSLSIDFRTLGRSSGLGWEMCRMTLEKHTVPPMGHKPVIAAVWAELQILEAGSHLQLAIRAPLSTGDARNLK